MATIGPYEAKIHLPALLKRVEAGERITITRNGRPIAQMVPISEGEGISAADAIDELLAAGRGRRLNEGLTVRDLIEDGRR